MNQIKKLTPSELQHKQIDFEFAMNCVYGVSGTITRMLGWESKKEVIKDKNIIKKLKIMRSKVEDIDIPYMTDDEKVAEIIDTLSSIERKFNEEFDKKYGKDKSIRDNDCLIEELYDHSLIEKLL